MKLLRTATVWLLTAMGTVAAMAWRSCSARADAPPVHLEPEPPNAAPLVIMPE